MALTGLTEIQFTNLNVTGVATFAQSVGIAGTLSYEDVTNIDSVGVVTARVGVNVPAGQLDVGSNVKIGHSGVTTASSFKTGTSNVHSTGYECTNINATGVVTAAQFKGDGSNLSGLASREFYGFKTVNEDLILIHTNNGADNISKSDFESFEDTMTAPSGLSFSINSAGELEMTI